MSRPPILSQQDVATIVDLVAVKGLHPADVALGYSVSPSYISQIALGLYRPIPGYEYPTVLPFLLTEKAKEIMADLNALAEKRGLPVLYLHAYVYAAMLNK